MVSTRYVLVGELGECQLVKTVCRTLYTGTVSTRYVLVGELGDGQLVQTVCRTLYTGMVSTRYVFVNEFSSTLYLKVVFHKQNMW